MKHQSKQALAWVLAFGASSVVYGGGSWWLKKLASRTSGDSAEHGEDTSKSHGEDSDHGTEHGAATSHDKGHGGEHAAKDAGQSEHGAKVDEHGNGHGDEHSVAKHDAKGHGEDHAQKSVEHGKVDEHAKADAHGKAEAEHHAEAKHEDKGHDASAKASSKGTHWSYEKSSAQGPNQWGNLSETFAQCEKGREQSPIDLKGVVTRASAPKITWSYNPVAVNIENNGHTIVANMPDSQNHISIDGETYTLAQFHFHNPSEHKVGGIPSDMELHFVHKNEKGGLAVIGVMLNEKAGGENPFLKPLWQSLPREAQSKAEAHPTLNLAKLLPTHRDYFHYAGSLTTPPCSQGVRWFVMKEPVSVSGSQVDLYSGIFGGPTNRPVQPLYGREIIQSVGPAAVAH